mmetsp:Transcript_29462/g.64896  ORF Transcript_29462/g.64896 Transcript_29462/m.64896 type:complete len:246 (+) Transcript_29462:70-807(+)
MRQPNKRPIDAAGRMRPTSWPLLLVVAASACALLPSLCSAGTLPTMLVESGKPKCVLVSVPMDTQLRVDYEAPDIDSGKGPVWITINRSRPMESLRDKMLPGRKQKDFTPLSEEIKAKEGSIKHVIEEDGELSVCVRASPASSKNPMRFGLAVHTGKSKSELTKKRDEEHLSGMEISLERLTDAMEDILDEADFAKEREMVFHNQSRSMAQASVYWPILHLSVLAITGVTMANHIVRFFKTHHII